MKTKLLAIDDSRTIRELISRSLEAAGFECHCAVDGLEGVKAYSRVQPDVVITEINMPNMDGFGVIEELLSPGVKSTVPILVLTTECSTDLRARARDAGATGWIVKPFEDSALISVLRRVTGQGL